MFIYCNKNKENLFLRSYSMLWNMKLLCRHFRQETYSPSTGLRKPQNLLITSCMQRKWWNAKHGTYKRCQEPIALGFLRIILVHSIWKKRKWKCFQTIYRVFLKVVRETRKQGNVFWWMSHDRLEQSMRENRTVRITSEGGYRGYLHGLLSI